MNTDAEFVVHMMSRGTELLENGSEESNPISCSPFIARILQRDAFPIPLTSSVFLFSSSMVVEKSVMVRVMK